MAKSSLFCNHQYCELCAATQRQLLDFPSGNKNVDCIVLLGCSHSVGQADCSPSPKDFWETEDLAAKGNIQLWTAHLYALGIERIINEHNVRDRVDRVSLCSPGCPGTHTVDRLALNPEICLLLPHECWD